MQEHILICEYPLHICILCDLTNGMYSGGGNVQNRGMNRSRPPLRWMVFEAGSLGFRTTSTFKRDLSSQEQIEVQESLTWPWIPLEWIPFRRLTFMEPERETRM